MLLGTVEIILIVILALVLVGGWLAVSIGRELNNGFKSIARDKNKPDPQQKKTDDKTK